MPELAPMLWNSFGTIAALLQEIIAIYPAINPPVLTGKYLKLRLNERLHVTPIRGNLRVQKCLKIF